MSYSKYEKRNVYDMPDAIPKILLSDALFLYPKIPAAIKWTLNSFIHAKRNNLQKSRKISTIWGK